MKSEILKVETRLKAHGDQLQKRQDYRNSIETNFDDIRNNLGSQTKYKL
ncbi:MAG: hypothetical protein F6K55_11660 [Moorea sp. SIO4A3]|nr:hypothetical protein [Moorena sp. SIO4A3]